MFQKIKQKRIKIVLLVTILVLFIILFKIFYLQTVSNNKLSKLANDLWERNLPLTPDRGRILDRNGKVLATNITTTTLYAVPNQIVDKELTAKALSNILNCSYDSMLKHLTKKTSLEKINPEGRQLSSDIADKIAALNIDGLYLMKESIRYYPYDTVLAHTLGYVGIDNQGLSGLELQYDKYLTGKSGSIKYFSDGKGHRLNELEKYVPAVNGMDITLTIDIDIQLALENELNQADSKYSPEESLAIVMDPNTGEIIAMASRPTFDSCSFNIY